MHSLGRPAVTSLPSLLLLALVGLGAGSGCTSSSGDDPAAESADLAAARTALSPHDAHVRDVAIHDQTPRVEAMFGRFATGAAAFYRGTFEAKDNISVLGTGVSNGVFPHGPAIASVITNRDGQGGVTLGVVGPESGQHVELLQNGAVTMISLVNAPNTSGGLLSSCTGCVVDLAPHPPALTFSGVVARGEYGNFPPSPSEVTASGSFTLVPASQLAFDDIRQLRMLDAAFIAVGSDMVATARDRVYDFQATTDADDYPCYVASDYAIDLWVNRAKITQHGLRNFQLVGARTCCATGEGEGSGICEPLERSKSLATGVGNSAFVTLEDKLVGATNVTRTLKLAYTDATGYFRRDPRGHAVVIVHTATIHGESTKTLGTALTLADRIYAGEVTLPGIGPIVSIELAFSDSSERTWDSNLSRNYRVEL
jgi:hypothetical protein